ncbi:Zn-ribbon domain-containing OB-fold protein [Chloroflexota bacterium]
MADYEKPLPLIDEENTQYWEYCRKHELRLQKCTECGLIRSRISVICPNCNSMESEWAKLSGKGKVFSFIIYHRAFHPAYANDIPYDVAIIELDEGPRIQSNVVDCNVNDIKIDMPVEVYFDDVSEDISLPKFRPIN